MKNLCGGRPCRFLPSARRLSAVWPVLCLGVFLAASLLSASGQPAPVEGYKIIHAYPHDPNAFTQGLFYLDGYLYESTGLNGRSSVRMVDIKTGKVLQHYKLPSQYFGEGLTDWGSTLVQLTWMKHTGFVYDRFSLRLLRTFHYPWQGWGLTHDATSLIMSDGSDTLRFLDPHSFRETRQVVVKDDGRPIKNLNELEYIHGEIYANIWNSNRIAIISPTTGKVLSWIDLSGLKPPDTSSDPNAVLNGIAYDAKDKRLFVTGKLWPKLFEIKVIPYEH